MHGLTKTKFLCKNMIECLRLGRRVGDRQNCKLVVGIDCVHLGQVTCNLEIVVLRPPTCDDADDNASSLDALLRKPIV